MLLTLRMILKFVINLLYTHGIALAQRGGQLRSSGHSRVHQLHSRLTRDRRSHTTSIHITALTRHAHVTHRVRSGINRVLAQTVVRSRTTRIITRISNRRRTTRKFTRVRSAINRTVALIQNTIRSLGSRNASFITRVRTSTRNLSSSDAIGIALDGNVSTTPTTISHYFTAAVHRTLGGAVHRDVTHGISVALHSFPTL